MNWTTQQSDALSEIKEWLTRKGKENQVFRLFGYAGTGKTTLTKEIASMVDGSICYAAFTGKAASVMRRKGCAGATTIHSLIYILEKSDFGEPIFVLNRDSEVRHSRLVVIDECSMMDEEIGLDLLSFGTKILAIGDPAQLPPVKGAGFFTSQRPDALLTEVHRQAAENPIIALSMQIRNGDRLSLGEYGETRIISRADVNAEIVLGSDQVIVGLNRSRELYNARIRSLMGRVASTPCKEDKLICLKNDRTIGVFNGTMWEVEAVTEKRNRFDMAVKSLDEDSKVFKKIEVLGNFFDGSASELHWKEKSKTQEFTFGYAITCHKSQGSQWNNVTVFDESGAFRDDAGRWLYTAVTRAAEKLTLVIQ